MADVPAWVLVLNTVAAGGFGLLGTYIVPRAQRESRVAEERRANAAIMRDKAEQIFRVIADMDNAAQQNLILAVTSALGDKSDAGPVVTFHEARGLAAVYFPNLLPILDKFEAPAEKRMERVAAMTEAARSGDRAGMLAAAQALNARKVQDGEKYFLAATRLTRELRAQLIEDLKPYLPGV